MNLHNIVSGAVGIVNPHSPGEIRISVGYDIAPSGKQVPRYITTPVTAQIQPLTFTDLQHTNGLNIQGMLKAAYVNGNFNAVNRPRQQGGDLLIINGEEWLIVQILEEWPNWCKFTVTLQRREQ